MLKFLAVLGGNQLACRAIEQLEINGYNVLVLDKNPVELAYKIASKVIPIDFSDSEKTIAALEEIDLCGVMAINDFGVVTAAKIAKEKKLFGYNIEAAYNVAEKTRMKDCWKKDGILTAKHNNYTITDIKIAKIDWNIFPCIIKPSFVGGASRGVFYIENEGQLKEKLSELTQLYPSQNIVIEEFIQGTEHTIEVLVFDGRTHLMSISDKKNYPGNKTIVQDLWFPGPKGNLYRKQLEELLHNACMSLGLTFGCAHFEIMITPSEKIYLIEVGGRPGGGLNFHPISLLTTGYDYTLELASILTTGKPILKRIDSTIKLVWHFFNPTEGVIKEIKGFEKIRNLPEVVESDLMVSPGKKVDKELRNDMERLGHYLFKYDDPHKVAPFIKSCDEVIQFVME